MLMCLIPNHRIILAYCIVSIDFVCPIDIVIAKVSPTTSFTYGVYHQPAGIFFYANLFQSSYPHLYAIIRNMVALLGSQIALEICLDCCIFLKNENIQIWHHHINYRTSGKKMIYLLNTQFIPLILRLSFECWMSLLVECVFILVVLFPDPCISDFWTNRPHLLQNPQTTNASAFIDFMYPCAAFSPVRGSMGRGFHI